MPEASLKARTKMKICVVGEQAVGKTSLIRRIGADEFNGEHVRTLGTPLTKKTVEAEGPMGKPTAIDVVLWDITGERSFIDLLKEAYFYNADGIFAVLDITRRESLEALHGWLEAVFDTAKSPSVIILANKSDLHDQREVPQQELVKLSEGYDAPLYHISAKTGNNCRLAFQDMIELALERGGRPALTVAESGQVGEWLS